MPDARARVIRTAVAVIVLPHELSHALAAWLCRLEPEVTVLPAWRGESRPLAQFNAPLDSDTSTLAIRAVAVAPFLLMLVVASLLGSVIEPDSLLILPLLLVLSFWGSLSSGDLAIASQPRRAREYGEFLAPRPPQIENLALGGTVLTVVLVGALLLR